MPATKTAPKPAAKAAAKTAAKPAPKPATAAPNAGHVTTSVSVDLVVNTEDQLRRIEFGLEKSIDDDGQPKWVIHFKLSQRADKATPYGDPRVQLDVVVDKNLHGKAADTAAHGLNAAQTAHLAGPGVKAALDSTKPGGKPADQKVQATLTK